MTGNLSRTVLRGAGARESACLPDVTPCAYPIQNFLRRNSIILYRIIRGILYKKKEELM